MVGEKFGTFTLVEMLSERPALFGAVCDCGHKERILRGKLKSYASGNLKCPVCKSKPKKDLTVASDSPPDILELFNQGKIRQGAAALRQSNIETLLELLPIAEETYRQTQAQHAAYAYTNLLTQLKDTLASLEGADSESLKNDLISSIVSRALLPVFTGLGQSLIDNMYRLQTELAGMDTSHQKVQATVDTTKAIGQSLQQAFNELRQKIALHVQELNI